jgi:hypothetical protein
MAAAFLNNGLTGIRDGLKTTYPQIGLASDNTAFAATQTRLNPSAAGTVLIKAATFTDLTPTSYRGTISVNGSTEFTNATIFTVGICKTTDPTTAGSRSVRTQGIGVQAGDSFTIGVEIAVSDIS